MERNNEQKRLQLFTSIPMKETEWFLRYKRLAQTEKEHVLLESGRGGRYHIIGLRPVATIHGYEQTLTVNENGEIRTKEGSLLDGLKDVLAPYMQETNLELPEFQGGAIGYLSYDIAREIEPLQNKTVDDIGIPHLHFMIFDDVFVYDRVQSKHFVIVHGTDQQNLKKRLTFYVNQWNDCSMPSITKQKVTDVECMTKKKWVDSMTEDEFCAAVEKIKSAIVAGDVYQVNISLRQSKELKSEPFTIYEQLRLLNPSPYMAYYHTEQFQLVSGSPELLIRKYGKKVSARPIGGTRSRGGNELEDEKMIQSLLQNEKEIAEHMMLVDLERNDLGKIAAYGTVEVNEQMVIEKYSHVMHLVSNVQAELADNQDLYDVIRAKFPGGTITGAPKIQTMEMIEELEPVRRGVYTGSIGWIGFDGNMELNIAIRTMVCKDDLAHVQAGAGVVVDSNPKHEYEESLKKGKALWQAQQLAERKE